MALRVNVSKDASAASALDGELDRFESAGRMAVPAGRARWRDGGRPGTGGVRAAALRAPQDAEAEPPVRSRRVSLRAFAPAPPSASSVGSHAGRAISWGWRPARFARP